MKTLSPVVLAIVLYCTFLFSINSIAQKQISGVVEDANGVLSYVNVLLLQPSDSSLVTGNLTDEKGVFLLEKIEAGEYILQVNMVGYQNQYSDVFSLEDKSGVFDFPKITLLESTSELNEVQVVAKRALIEQKIDRMVVNVSNSVTSAGNTALEILRRSPGVVVNPQTNSISMSGKDGVVVMINGKISRIPMDALIQMLDGMSSDNIDKIELIHTPPANYDAEGNAGFINIVLKKNQNEGFNGGYSLNAGYGKREKIGASLNLNYRKNKVNVFGDYSWNYNNNPQLFTNYRSFMFEGNTIENIGSGDRDPTKTHVHNAQLGLDIQLSEKTVLGVLASWMDRDWDMDALNEVEIKENGTLINRLNIPNEEQNHSYRILGNINLQHQIDKTQKVNLDFDYAYFFNDNPSYYRNQEFDGNDNLLSESEFRVSKITPMNIMVGKFDYSKSFGENIDLDMGIKGTFTVFDNDVLVEDKIGTEWIRASFFSSEANMKENIAAAYTSVSWKISDKVNLKSGLRYEYTDVNLSSNEQPDLVDRKYGRLFPSLFISNKMNEKNTVQFSYSRRINRPSFRQLAPWFYFQDPNTVNTGNPLLQPSITDALRATYIWKTFTLSTEYAFTDEAIGRFQPEIDQATNTQINGAKNFINAQNVSATLSLPLTLKDWWSLRTNWTAQWNEVTDKIDNQEVSFRQKSWYVNGSSTFTLPKQFSIEISGTYFAPQLMGSVIWESFNSVNVGVQKELPNGSRIGISANDIFLGGNWRGRLEDQNVDFIYEGYYGFSERVFRLTYSHRFGNSKVKAARKRATGSAEEMRRTN